MPPKFAPSWRNGAEINRSGVSAERRIFPPDEIIRLSTESRYAYLDSAPSPPVVWLNTSLSPSTVTVIG
jgi:hypothetical protein